MKFIVNLFLIFIALSAALSVAKYMMLGDARFLSSLPLAAALARSGVRSGTMATASPFCTAQLRRWGGCHERRSKFAWLFANSFSASCSAWRGKP